MSKFPSDFFVSNILNVTIMVVSYFIVIIKYDSFLTKFRVLIEYMMDLNILVSLILSDIFFSILTRTSSYNLNFEFRIIQSAKTSFLSNLFLSFILIVSILNPDLLYVSYRFQKLLDH